MTPPKKPCTLCQTPRLVRAPVLTPRPTAPLMGHPTPFPMADVSRDKSARACLPVTGTEPRHPKQARSDYHAQHLPHTPCPTPSGLPTTPDGPSAGLSRLPTTRRRVRDSRTVTDPAMRQSPPPAPADRRLPLARPDPKKPSTPGETARLARDPALTVLTQDEPVETCRLIPRRTARWTSTPVAAEMIHRTAPLMGHSTQLPSADLSGGKSAHACPAQARPHAPCPMPCDLRTTNPVTVPPNYPSTDSDRPPRRAVGCVIHAPCLARRCVSPTPLRPHTHDTRSSEQTSLSEPTVAE